MPKKTTPKKTVKKLPTKKPRNNVIITAVLVAIIIISSGILLIVSNTKSNFDQRSEAKSYKPGYLRRATANPTKRPTATPTPQVHLTSCNKPCSDFPSNVCPAGFTCYQPPMPTCPPGQMCAQVMPVGVCRKNECRTSETCGCAISPTLTPTAGPKQSPTPTLRPDIPSTPKPIQISR